MLPDPPLHVLTCPADFRPGFKDSAAGWKNLDHETSSLHHRHHPENRQVQAGCKMDPLMYILGAFRILFRGQEENLRAARG